MEQQSGTSGNAGSRPNMASGNYKIPRPPRYGGQSAATTLTPREIFWMLRRHMLLIASMVVLGFVVGGVAWFILLKLLPKYTAVTYIEILPPVTIDPTQISSVPPHKDIAYQHRVSLATLMRNQSSLQRLLRNDKVRATEWFASFDSDLEQIEDLEDHLHVVPQRESQYISVSMTCGDRKETALIVNEMVGLFLASRSVRTKGEIKDKLTQLRQQEARTREQLQFAEDELKEVARRSGFSMLGEELWHNTLTTKLADLEVERNTLSRQIWEMEAALKTYEQRLKGPLGVSDQRRIETDPIMLQLAGRLAMLEADLARQLMYLGENHRSVRQNRESIRETRAERMRRQQEIGELERQSNYIGVRDALENLRSSLEELEKDRVEADAEHKELSRWAALYEQRADIRDQLREQLDSVKESVAKYEILHNDPETPKVRSMGSAPEPLRVSSPKWEFYFPGGTVLGMLAGIGLAFLIELLNDLVRTPTDVSKHLQIPLLGMICHADEDDDAEGVELSHVVRQAPYSIISECYRQLRTHLKLSGPAEKLKTLLISSGSAGDGRTSIAVNLAAAFVAEDKKVLLVDANFRRPAFTKLFPKAGSSQPSEHASDSPANDLDQGSAGLGLSNLLAGQCSYDKVIRPSGIEGLDLIDSGPLPSNPAELLGNARMKQLTEEQRKEYDYIIVDGPPVLLVSEAKILASQLDSVLLVCNADATRRGAAQRTIRELRETGANIVGCVLFGAHAMKGGYFRELFKSYQEYQKAQLAAAI